MSTPFHRWLWIAVLLLLLPATGALLLAAPAEAQIAANVVAGTVTDPDGDLPPPNTKVLILRANGETHGQAQVNLADGSFSIGPLPPGGYVLQARPPEASGFTNSLPKSIFATGAPIDVGTLALTTPALSGTVYAPDGVTTATARVDIYRAGHRVDSFTAADGTYQFGGLLTGTYRLQAQPLGDVPYWDSPRTPVTVTLSTSDVVDLALRPANVTGRAVDPQGVPMAGATVHAVGAVNHTFRQDVTTAGGYFSIGGLITDTYVLVVEPPWWADSLIASAPVTFTVPPALTDVGDVALRDAPKLLQGRVETNTGVPVEQARIVAHRVDHPGRQATRTDADGEYQLRLGSGLWSVTVEPTPASDPAHWLFPHPPQLVFYQYDLEPELKNLDFTVLTADAQVSGTVTMPDGGVPPFSVTVKLHNDEGLGRSTVADPADGSFALRIPHGTYALTIHPADDGFAGPDPQPVYAPENGAVDVGALALEAKSAVLSGTVTDAHGDGIGGVNLIAWSRFERGGRTITHPDGMYGLAVAPDSYLIRPQIPFSMPYIYAGDPISVTVDADETATGLDFQLTDAPNQIRGQLVDPDGQPVLSRGTVTAQTADGPVNSAPVAGGAFFVHVPDGTYQLQVTLGPGQEWIPGPPPEVSVSGGEIVTTPVSVLPKNAAIAGALWDPRQEIVPAGVNGYVMADNPLAWVADTIDPGNGTYYMDVSAGLWFLNYGVAPESGYVALDHGTAVPVEEGETMGVPLPVAKRDGVLSGVILDPTGQPLAGAVVAADGVGQQIEQVTLRATSNENGEFRLAVPHGRYWLRAAYDEPAWLNPARRPVLALPHTTVDGITLQFQLPDVTLGGTTAVTGGDVTAGTVHIWAYSDAGLATRTRAPLGDLYELDLLSGQRWHVGAVLETGDSFYAVRETVTMTGANQTLDLVLGGPYAKPGPVAVSFDSAEPQSLQLADGTRIFIPAGALPAAGEVTLHITPIATFPHQHHARLYKYGYAFIATDADGTPLTEQFNQNVLISFTYEEAELEALNLQEEWLRPAYFSTTTDSWTIPAGYVVDTVHNRVVLQIDHFTDYTLLGVPQMYQLYLPMVK